MGEYVLRSREKVTDAFIFGVEDEPDWFLNERKKKNVIESTSHSCLVDEVRTVTKIKQLLGKYERVNIGEYVVKIASELRVMQPAIFNALYERANAIIDNHCKIIELLKFRSPDDFYEIVILDRAKDHDDGRPNGTITIKKYMISSNDTLALVIPEIKAICNALHCRAYIYLNTRSNKATAFEQLNKAIEYIKNGSFRHVKRAFNVTKSTSNARKVFILDYDNNVNELKSEDVLNRVSEFTEVLGKIDTPNGCHFILKPFNKLFIKDEQLLKYEIKRDSPTLLYSNTIIK